LKQDEDCLDTWFSSWLWPISVFDGINNPDNEDIKYYYPTNDLVTAPEIIFFWVARMIMSGYEYRREACFQNVYFTGIVRDKLGRKMSKSLGNSPDPIELMEKYGADGVRMGMLLTSPAGNDLLFDEALCEQGRNFSNKIWNVFRLMKGWEEEMDLDLAPSETSRLACDWFRARFNASVIEMNDCYAKYRLNEALMVVYKLFWDDFSSWYLEIIKPAYGQNIDSYTYAEAVDIFDDLLCLLHPFMPFITEELWQEMLPRGENDSIMNCPMPTALSPDKHIDSEDIIRKFEKTQELIANIRTVRLQKNLPNKEALTLNVIGEHDPTFDAIIKKMGHISDILHVTEKLSGSVSFLSGACEYAIPMEGMIDSVAEKAKREEEIAYLEGFLRSVMAKLNNEKFMANAKPQVIENELKKKADAELKLQSLRGNN
jgi:valyl-tRNA synthetase